MNIFSSVKIVDLSKVFSGPFATRHFADFGAEVIKIEPPGGEDSRSYPPLIENWSGYFEVLNRNKKSLVLNLNKPRHLNKLYALCEEADVLVENFSPNVSVKLKIDYQSIKKHNPSIVYASITGVSQNVNRKYYDVIAQAESGFMSLNGVDEDMKVATSVVDAFSGMKLAFAISSALYDRERTGNGCQLSVSMKGAAFDLLEQNLIDTSVTNELPTKIGNMDSAIAPFGVFKTKDGSLALAIGSNKLWQIFMNFLLQHKSSLATELLSTNDLRLKNVDLLKKEIEAIFKLYTTKKIKCELDKLKVPSAEVLNMHGVLKDKENFSENLLENHKAASVGEFTTPSGGIFYSSHNKVAYRQAPKLNDAKDNKD